MGFKIGSLFDGSGGFPLAGFMCGGVPVWASEVEPYPIAVTKSRFPHMKHLGSVTDVRGNEVEPVDVITFGSPCQDLSIAGKRAGLKHEDNGDDETTRSGLFMEAVRIIKEMREATNGVYPRFALWENVPGAFSSNKGEDFRTVLEELIKIVEPTATMPTVPKNGWPYADLYCGDGWSLAYRTLDAQYWGVPQRRRRIYLVVDFRGQCAGEVLFEREGLRGYFETGRTPWKGVAGDAENCAGTDDCKREFVVPYTLKIRSGCEGGGKGALIQTDKSATLSTLNDQYLFQPMSLREENWVECCVKNAIRAGESKSSHAVVERYILDDQGGSQINVRTDGKSPTLRAEMHGNIPCVMESAGFCPEESAKTRGVGFEDEKSPTLRAGANPAIVYSVENHPADSRVDIDDSGKVQTLTSRMGTGGGNVPLVMEPTPIHDQATRFSGKRGDKSDGKGNGLGVGKACDPMNTLTAGDRHAVAYCTDVGFFNSQENVSPTLLARQYKDPHLVSYQETEIRYIVRRLTPTECARLQGFADRWGDIDEKDSFTQEEYAFWLNVRNTHAAINGKAVKNYTEAQMLTWYNKLHTDSSEYKLWGNGIALPTALYVMQGIGDVFDCERN